MQKISQNENTIIFFQDEMKSSNRYYITTAEGKTGDLNLLAEISFQNGAIKENGVNGAQIEDLIQICIDRLYRFQKGNFNCKANAMAVTKLEEAENWLNRRTMDRKMRGVEGTEQL